MEKIAVPGDRVYFIGNSYLATDEGTYDIMEHYMTIYSWYTVKNVNNYFGSGVMHYLLVENGAYIPCGCFSKDKKIIIKDLYNLR